MSEDANPNQRDFTIRIMRLTPGTQPEDVLPTLCRIFKSRSTDEIRWVLRSLPLVLTRKATKEQALQMKKLLESKGAVLKVTASSPARRAPDPAGPSLPAEPPATSSQTPPPVPREEKPTGVERRRKPRIHAGIELHPMDIGEILDRAFRLIKQYFWLCFFILLIPQGILFVFSHGIQIVAKGWVGQTPSLAMGLGIGVFFFVVFIAFLIFQFWAQGALIYGVSEAYLGHSTSVKGSYGAMRGLLIKLVGTMILWAILVFGIPALAGIIMAVIIPLFKAVGSGGLVIALLVIAVVILAIWLFFRLFIQWLLVDKVVVLEGIAWMKALRRSKQLMQARTEPGFFNRPGVKAGLLLLIGFAIAMGVNLVFQIPAMILGFIFPGNLFIQAVQGLFYMTANTLATLYTATAMILFYYDIRLRKEGFDLKMMAENL